MNIEDLKIFHGPESISGIPNNLAELETKKGLHSDYCFYEKPKFHSTEIKSLGLKKIGLVRNISAFVFFLKTIRKYNTFHFYFGKTFLHFNLDLPILMMLGKKTVMTYCGTDIRLINLVDKQRNPYIQEFESIVEDQLKKKRSLFLHKLLSPFIFKYNHSIFDRRKVRMMKFQNRFIDRFIAIRDNYSYCNYAIPKEKITSDILINNITAQAVNEGVIHQNDLESSTDRKLIIAHAPTNPGIKGSHYFEKAINELISEGYRIKYVKVINMKFEEAKASMIQADIILDQLICGGIGSVSIEAMSYGKPVVAYLMQDVIDDHCPDIPICNATIDNVKEVLRELVENEELRKRKSEEGISFIRKYYNKDKMVDQLIKLYLDL